MDLQPKQKSAYEQKIKAIQIGLASPANILAWSHGQITKPETINYKSHNIIRYGLFDEVIFGPCKNYECACGKYKKIQNRGLVCERCQVEVTSNLVRRERMGHIVLHEPVAHIWMIKNPPSPIAFLLDFKTKQIEDIVYFVNYVILDPGQAKYLKYKMILEVGHTERAIEIRKLILQEIKEVVSQLDPGTFAHEFGIELINDIRDIQSPFSADDCGEFLQQHLGVKIGIGARAIQEMLSQVNIQADIDQVEEELEETKSKYRSTYLTKKWKVLKSFAESQKKPEWMVLTVLPVMPAGLRPVVQLDNGLFTAAEINDLYRSVIISNERLKKALLVDAPTPIINNARRLLQETVDALFDNERRANPVKTKDNRPLKSISSTLKGKQGRFRQNLLGKRVDYSGHSVIVVDPKLKLYQCGLPREMAFKLFYPFLIRDLIGKNYAPNIKIAQKIIEARENVVYDLLEEVVKERPVLLNRPPTLYCLGIEAYEPVLWDKKTIGIHPLETTKFNADCDGDQMAVHVPLSPEAVAECRGLMMGFSWTLLPNGRPGVLPSQDMVLGLYYLTKEIKGSQGEGLIFSDTNQVLTAYERGDIALHALIGVEVAGLGTYAFDQDDEKQILITTPGKVIFNLCFLKPFPWVNSRDTVTVPHKIKDHMITYQTNIRTFITNRWQVNLPLPKKSISAIVYKYFRLYGANKCAPMLDQLKEKGFLYARKSGVSIVRSDIEPYGGKEPLFKKTETENYKIYLCYKQGLLTKQEFKKIICQRWAEVKTKIQRRVAALVKAYPDNPVFMMADSGARGNISNFTQLIGMRGLMSNAKNEIIEVPVKSCFSEGLKSTEYLISSYGARKGRVDVSLKTADAGYLTRRLVDVAQKVFVTMADCQPKSGFKLDTIYNDKDGMVILELQERLFSRFLFKDLILKNGTIIKNDHPLTEAEAVAICRDHQEVVIRSPLTCEAKDHGVCQKCFGLNLLTLEMVKMYATIGVQSAQAIGEPGTQLTMRNFHTGGIAGQQDITLGLPRITEIMDVVAPHGLVAEIATVRGHISRITSQKNERQITITSDFNNVTLSVPINSTIIVQQGDFVERGDKLTEGNVNMQDMIRLVPIAKMRAYILGEVQKVYRLQGIEIADKYIEVIIKQMLSYVRIVEAGETTFIPGDVVLKSRYQKANLECIKNGKKPARAIQILLGLKKLALMSDSFLSAASFQETTRVLCRAIINNETDHLKDLKSTMMLGGLIDAGTGRMTRSQVLRMGDRVYSAEY